MAGPPTGTCGTPGAVVVGDLGGLVVVVVDGVEVVDVAADEVDAQA
ncbi:MAG TPA: hypothetical protein VLX59_16810 [Acidimicrobiales bacterium]|nr:hypothetical protein [Acidimicrobiales bacterium]